MKDLPHETRTYLKRVVQGFPKTPYTAAKAIQNHVKLNITYGCEENILQENWARWPHEIKKYMTCQEAGIYNFLLTRELGLDSILIEFENFDGTNQNHMGALIKGHDNDYLLANDDLEKVKFNPNGKSYVSATSTKDKIKFSNMRFLDIPDVAKRIKLYKNPSSIREFFATGQTSSTYYGANFKEVLFYAISRHFTITNNELHLRKTMNTAGYFLNLFFTPNDTSLVFSSGINNSIIKNSVPLFRTRKEDELKIFDVDKEIEHKLITAYTKQLISGYLAREKILNITNRNTNTKINKRVIEPLSPQQKKLALFHAMATQQLKYIKTQHIEKFIANRTFSDGDIVNRLATNSYHINSEDKRSYYKKKTNKIMKKLEALVKKQGINSFKVL